MKKKILFFAQQIHAPWIEWVKNNSINICQGLSRKMNLDIISHKWSHNSLDSDTFDNVKVYYLLTLRDNKILQFAYLISWGFRSLFFVLKNKPKKIFVQYLDTSYLFTLILIRIFKPRMKIILTLYSTDEVHIWYKRIFLKYFPLKKVVIISEYLRPLIKELWYKNKDIIHIPLSYDRERYLKYTSPKNRNKKKILFSAWPIQEAGSFFMVDLAKIMPDYTFIFTLREFDAKSEGEVELLKKYIKQEWVKNIEILRNIENMPELLSEVWAFVLPLQTTNVKMLVPVALLEALARWTLCFVSDLPHLKKLVKHTKEAIIFDRKDISDLQKKMKKYIDSETIPKNAFEFAEKYPSFDDIVKEYYKLI